MLRLESIIIYHVIAMATNRGFSVHNAVPILKPAARFQMVRVAKWSVTYIFSKIPLHTTDLSHHSGVFVLVTT